MFAVLGAEVEGQQVPGNRSVPEVDERQVPERHAPVSHRLAGAADPAVDGTRPSDAVQSIALIAPAPAGP